MQEALDLSFDRLLMMMMMMMMMIDSPFFSLQNSVCFIILTYLVTELFTFYIQNVLKLKKIPSPKVSNTDIFYGIFTILKIHNKLVLPTFLYGSKFGL